MSLDSSKLLHIAGPTAVEIAGQVKAGRFRLMPCARSAFPIRRRLPLPA
jgi:hypothetical protein